MVEALLELNKPIGSEELHEIVESLAPILVTASERTELSFQPPPEKRAESGIGLQNFMGIDPATILVVAISSGASIFLTKLTQEIAVDFWKAIKRVLRSRSKSHRVIAVNSVQLRMTLHVSSGVSMVVVTTWFNSRFVEEVSVAKFARAWYEQLLPRIDQANASITPEMNSPDRRGRSILVHAVIYGSGAPVWDISVTDGTSTAEQP